jgi:hypothetical protein
MCARHPAQESQSTPISNFLGSARFPAHKIEKKGLLVGDRKQGGLLGEGQLCPGSEEAGESECCTAKLHSSRGHLPVSRAVGQTATPSGCL